MNEPDQAAEIERCAAYLAQLFSECPEAPVHTWWIDKRRCIHCGETWPTVANAEAVK